MKNKLLLTVTLSLLFFNDMLAQLPILPTDDGNVEDVPVHFLVYPLIALGAFLGFKVFNKK